MTSIIIRSDYYHVIFYAVNKLSRVNKEGWPCISQISLFRREKRKEYRLLPGFFRFLMRNDYFF